MRWKLSLRAQADLWSIGRYIGRDNPQAAAAWLRKLQQRARLAARSPRQGRKVPEIDRDDVREAVVGMYRIVYVIRPKLVEVLTIFEGHQLLPDDLELP